MKYLLSSSLVVVIIAWLFSGQEKPLPILAANYALKDTIWLSFKETISIESENIHLSFDKVEDESRCPHDWKCLWKGVANVRLTLKKGKLAEMVELTQQGRCDISCGNWKEAFGYHLQLIEVTPYPDAVFYGDEPLDFREYVAKLVVSKSPKIYSAGVTL